MKQKILLVVVLWVLTGVGYTYAQNRSVASSPDPQKEKLLKLAESFRQKQLIQRAEVERVAKEKGWNIRQESPEGVSEIQYIDQFGFPQSYSTTNVNAAKTTNTNKIYVGGTSGLNLTGSGYLVGEWDGGGVLTTHQEFNNGAGTRVTQMDGPIATSYHSTHVAGTILAEGQTAAAHGMATEAIMHAYEWTNDNTEMASEASGGLTLSNHSYGWNRGWTSSSGNMYWYGNTTISTTEDYLFGFYDTSAQEWDQIAFDAPNYLIVKASGNDRNDSYTGGHYIWNGAAWVFSNAARPADGGADGYDCIDQHGVPKNILTVGAVEDIPGGWTTPANVVQSTFSSWGPTDDGRIKPDLVANGVGVYSTSDASNTSYTTLDGTSMATPNVTGSLILLQEHYKSLKGGVMSSAALKGLVINTANEAGAANGPDYQNGHGLMNALGAANLITSDNTQGGLIVQATLANGQTTDYTYYSNGTTPINVTLCWTDPAGTPPAASLNPTTLMLVNNLDVRVIGTATNFPWILNPASPSAAATKGDNNRDNVETVNMLTPTAGYYTVRVNHSGVLSGGSQAYALIITGMTTPPVDNYCSARTTFNTYEYISHVVMGTINNTTGRSPGGFGDFTGMVNTMIKGTSETLTVTVGSGFASDLGKAWVDWNQDGDFADSGEEFALGSGAGPTYSVSIPTPMTALSGYTTMRVRLGYISTVACGNASYGETEDYTIKVTSGCAASGGCVEHISRVQAGTIDNTTGCNNYTDYTGTESTDLPVNGIVHVTVTNGSPYYSSDQCGVWVDWNRNGSFYDAGEQMTVATTPGVGPYTAAIIPPVGQPYGNCTMRVRITYTGALDPCGSTTYGEVEDYNLNITAAVPNVWVGQVSNAWENPMNWSLEHVPTTGEDVTINTGYIYYPIVAAAVGNCADITIGAGAKLSVGANDLYVSGSMYIYGLAEETNVNADFFVTGAVIWEPGSNANILAGEFHVDGNWEFRDGSQAQLANGYVYFEGAATSLIRSYETNCHFNHVINSKTAGYFQLSVASTDTLKINGFYNNGAATSVFYSNTTVPVVLKGQLNNSGHIYCPYGTFIFDGTTHNVNLNTGDYFNNLVISSTGAVTMGDSLRVHADLTINSGSLVAGSYPILIGGNWDNNVGTGAFNEGTGKVVFNGGNYHQYCSNETFNILEVDKSLGGAFRMNGTNVICAAYDWTAGAVDVLAGSFTANDLVDNGLYGNYYVNAGGTINLHNTDGYVDLNGNLYVLGGNFNVYGGLGIDSFWPFTTNGSITMSAGVLDFKDVGVYVYNTGAVTFSEAITGGTIRTSRGFGVNRADYTPDGGTVEFYGATDGSLYTLNGGYVRNVVINKAVLADNSGTGSHSVIRNRETNTVTDAPMSNTVNVSTAADINGNVTIQSGVLNAGTATLNVEGNWNNTVGAAAFTEGIGAVVFDGAAASDVISTETFYNLNLNKTYAALGGLQLLQNVWCLNDLHLIDGTMEINYPANLSVLGNVTLDLGSGLNISDASPVLVNVGKNWTDGNTSSTTLLGFYPGLASIVTFNGTLDQIMSTANSFEFFSTLIVDKTSGKFRPADNTSLNNSILITNGTWEDNVSGLIHSLSGDFFVSATGAFLTTAMSNTVEFYGYKWSTLTYSAALGYFRNILVNKPAGYYVSQASNVSCQLGGNLTVNAGSYRLNGHQLVVAGDVAVENPGILTMSPSSELVLLNTKNLNVNAGGRLEVLGTSANPATIRANVSSARYALNINAGATIAADYGIFKNMGVSGVNVAAGAAVDPAHPFKGCTFQDGAAAGTLLTINNNQVLTIHNANFPANTWGGAFNVSKTVNSGHVYFVDYTGGYGGESFDSDAFNLVDWVATMTATATATPAAICAGSSTQLNVNRIGGWGPFTYAWSPAGSLSNPAIINPVASPLATTTYSVTVTDFLGTVVTSSIPVTVNPVLPVIVNVSASANPSPPGSFVTFTASPVNGGSIPSYQWKVNGANVGTGLPTYSYVPSNNDQVKCVMTSNYTCPLGNPATSNTVTMIIVNTNTTVTGNVPSPLSLCFDASNTITVAGGATTFVVQAGASVTMIAGVKISYLPGTRVMSGGYMHGYITTTNAYCGSLPPAMVSVVAGEEEAQPLPVAGSQMFSIYPNPTTGAFTISHKGSEPTGNVQVDILNMRGEKVLTTWYQDERNHYLEVRNMSPGLYFVKLMSGGKGESLKLVITR